MADSSQIISFVYPLASGSNTYVVDFPSTFENPPLVTASLQNTHVAEIVPYIISEITETGFTVIFASDLTADGYSLNVSAQVLGTHSTDNVEPFIAGRENGSLLGVLATRIYDEEIGIYTSGAERTNEIGLITHWLEGHLGELNNLIFTSFSGYNPDGFNLEEQGILREMYLGEYNRKAHRRVLMRIDGSNDSTGTDFEVIKEGDSMIQKASTSNKNVTAKTYRDAYLDCQEKIKNMVYSYNLYGAKPNQVSGGDVPASGRNPSLDGYYN